MIVNAAGAGAARVADLLTGREGAAQPMKGIALNLMLAGDVLTTGFTLVANSGGRARRLFVVPWRGRTLVGTAHYECERPPQSEAELEPYVERFVREVALAWPAREVARESVLLVHAGMQPSPHGSEDAAAHGPPEHQIIDHERDGCAAAAHRDRTQAHNGARDRGAADRFSHGTTGPLNLRRATRRACPCARLPQRTSPA